MLRGQILRHTFFFVTGNDVLPPGLTVINIGVAALDMKVEERKAGDLITHDISSPRSATAGAPDALQRLLLHILHVAAPNRAPSSAQFEAMPIWSEIRGFRKKLSLLCSVCSGFASRDTFPTRRRETSGT